MVLRGLRGACHYLAVEGSWDFGLGLGCLAGHLGGLEGQLLRAGWGLARQLAMIRGSWSLELRRRSLKQLLLQRCGLVQLLLVLLRRGLCRRAYGQRLRRCRGEHLRRSRLRDVLRGGGQGGGAHAGRSGADGSLLRRHPLLIVQQRLLLRGLAEVRRQLDRL